ncbi:MAG: hypothetical protein ACRDGI_07690, partial [Candidatus Limnocylindrales bacterium]
GQLEEGLRNLQAGIDLYQELRSPPIFWPFLLFLNARARLRASDPGDALPAVDSSIEFLSPGVGSSLLPEVYLVKGDLLAALAARDGTGPAPAAEWYRQALERAAKLDARTAQLRAATRLARLAQAAGEVAAARNLLAPVYASFTEGFAYPDLLDARAVLATLGE